MASAAPKHIAFRFFVEFEARPGGGLRAWSDDVPGFILSHSDCDAVLDDVEPVLEVILSAMFNRPVSVAPVQDLRDALENAGVIPIPPRIHPQGKQEYVSQLAA